MLATVLIQLALQTASGASSLPSGTYTGTASWRGPGEATGTYRVEKTFSGTTLSARYTWTEPAPREEQHTVEFAIKATEPTFDVLDGQGQVVGRGYCYDDACSYRATFGPVSVDESFRWTGNVMTVLGSKSGPGFSVVWKEALEAR